MTETEQAIAAIFTEAGWQPGARDGWDGKFVWRGTNVIGGIDPWGTPRTTGIVDNPNEGPNDLIAGAHWLVAHAREQRLAPNAPVIEVEHPAPIVAPAPEPLAEPAQQEETPQHETHGEAGEAFGEEKVQGGESREQAGVPVTVEGCEAGGDAGAEQVEFTYDAEFSEFDREAEALEVPLEEGWAQLRSGEWVRIEDVPGARVVDPLAIEAEIEDFAPDEGQAEAQPPQDRFYGLDDLDRRRSLRIGDVVRISHAKQAAIWEASGTTEDDYQGLVGAVMRDTINGSYKGPQETFDRFTALQATANAAAAVRRLEREHVAFLAEASREQIDTFDPEDGWPG